VETVRGPWLSLGIHADFQRRYVDLHILWWIITVGRDYYQLATSGQRPEI